MKKILICNIHNDDLLNKYTSLYIQTLHAENPSIRVLLENQMRCLEDDPTFVPTEGFGISYTATYVEETARSDSAPEAIFTLASKLTEIPGINLIGLKDSTTLEEEDKPLSLESLPAFLGSVPEAHDAAMLGFIREEKTDFVAVVGALHIVKWLIEGAVRPEEYKIIFPVHPQTLPSLLGYSASLGESLDSKAAKYMFNYVLSLEEMTVVDITGYESETLETPLGGEAMVSDLG